MEKKGLMLGVFITALALATSGFASQYKVVGERGDLYFGHISYVEIKNDGQDPVVFREGMKTPELAVLNLPLGPGDVIQTSAVRRCEIQFDNGTIVRLDFNTKLKIETILAQSLSTLRKMSNLLLAGGQIYIMYKKYDSLEIFQVITPHAAVKLSHNSVALVQLKDKTEVQVERGKASLLFGTDKFHITEKKIMAQQRVAVWADNTVLPAEYVSASDFRAWNEEVNANFKELHDENLLPKPIMNLPKAVWYFAQYFGNLYGEWFWHDLYGYVWRPYLNDFRYPWGYWQPYMYGNWAGYRNQLFWIPGEPWGWVPYHLGLWMWDKSKGWVWLPGSFFAPAWVDWEFFYGYYAWRPYFLLDFFDGWSDYDSYWAFYYGNGAVSGPRVTPPSYQPRAGSPVRTIITKDQLKLKTSPSLPLPKELKAALKATVAALRRGDERVQASLRELPRQSVIINKGDFGSARWQEKVISPDLFVKRPEISSRTGQTPVFPKSEYVAKDALRRYETSRVISEVNARMGARDRNSPSHEAFVPRDFSFDPGRRALPRDADISRAGERSYQPGPAAPHGATRFIDWNPDVRTGIRLGVDISYNSRTNEVLAPQLGLSSRDISPHFRLSPETYQSISSGEPGGGGGVAGSGSSSVAAAERGATGSGSSHGESGKAGGGEGKKN